MITSNEVCSSTSEPILVTVLSVTDPQCANGIESNLLENLVYPNPFKGTFHLRLGSPTAAGLQITLFDAQGKIVLLHKPDTGSELIELSVSEPGLYMLQIRDQEKSQTIRLFAL